MSWPKKITVDKRIVRILSGSTYANFPSAIREIIINSYDADSKVVNVDVDLRKEIISVRDDGKGMNEEDFSFYLRIAGRARKKELLYSEAKRKIVGQFGVGFLSALPFCEKYLIETKKKGSDEIVQATISSTEYFKDDYSSIDVGEIPIYGSIKKDASLLSEQFTRIRLVGFSSLTKSFFSGDYRISNRRNTIFNLDPTELLKWELAEYLPLLYDDRNTIGKTLNELIGKTSNLPFAVFFNGVPLFRHVHCKNILELSKDDIRIGDIRFRFFLGSNYKPLSPIQSRYIMLRNLNVGVGDRETFGLGMEGKIYGKLAHLTGDVFITDGLNELINVSRDNFNFSPDFEQLKEFIRNKLSHWANEFDAVQSIENLARQLSDESKVSDIKNLKKEKIEKGLASLERKGYKLKPVEEIRDAKDSIGVTKGTDTNDNLPFQIHRESKEVHIRGEREIEPIKVIFIKGKEYKLKVDNWDYIADKFPAIKFEDDLTIINESYPLFQNKKSFDTFLKIHIILLEYTMEDKITPRVYTEFISDIEKAFQH